MMQTLLQALVLTLTVNGPFHVHKVWRVYQSDLPAEQCAPRAYELLGVAKRRLRHSRVTGKFECLDQVTVRS